MLEYKVYVYNFADLRLMHHFETISNLKGQRRARGLGRGLSGRDARAQGAGAA